MNSRTILIASVALTLSGGVIVFAFLQRDGEKKIAERQKKVEQDLGNLARPMTSSIRYRQSSVDYEGLTTGKRLKS